MSSLQPPAQRTAAQAGGREGLIGQQPRAGMAPFSALAAAGTCPSLSSPQVPGERSWSRARQGPSSERGFPLMPVEAACSEPRIKSRQQRPVPQSPQDGSLWPPPSTCLAWASTGAPLSPGSRGPVRAGEGLKEAQGHRGGGRTM